jgi:hypothetical protein
MKHIIAKVLAPIAVLAMLPTSVAVAQPAAGMYGADAINSAAAVLAQKVVPKFVEEKFMASVSAYNPVAGQTDSDPDIVASGKKVQVGMVACSRDIPFGATVTMKFKSGKTFTGVCEDRMARKFDHATNSALSMPHFDILMFNYANAKQFGRQVASVSVQYSVN